MGNIHQLIGSKGTGSQIAELAFAAAGLPLQTEDLAWKENGLADTKLASTNPLMQVPTLILPSGSVLTQSAAIVFYVQDLAAHAALIPQGDLNLRTRFFHWLMILNAAVYPTFTYGDHPEKWLSGFSEASGTLRQSTDHYRNEIWKRAEPEAEKPWFLGQTFSALDLYICVMGQWRPGVSWFKQNTPKLTAIADKVANDPRFRQVISRNRN